MTQDIEPTKEAPKTGDEEILDRFNIENFVSFKDYIYKNPNGAELKPNIEDLKSFNGTFCRFLLVILPVIINRIEIRQPKRNVIVTKNAKYLSEMKAIVEKLANSEVCFFNSDNADFFEIVDGRKFVIGKILKSLLYVVNDNITRKLYNFDFHYNSCEKNSSLFKIKADAFGKSTKIDISEVNAKLNNVNNSLNSARVLWAERVTHYLKENNILCQAYDIFRDLTIIETSEWGSYYSIHYSGIIVTMPNSEAASLHNLKIHKLGLMNEHSYASLEKVKIDLTTVYNFYQESNPSGDKDLFIKRFVQLYRKSDYILKMAYFAKAWDEIIPKEQPAWSKKRTQGVTYYDYPDWNFEYSLRYPRKK